MTISLPLESMSAKEKVRVMELIWDDLCRDSRHIASPKWHEDVLRDRDDKARNGKEEYIDWDVAKKQLKDEVE